MLFYNTICYFWIQNLNGKKKIVNIDETDYIMIVFEYRVYIKCKDKGMYTMSNIYIYF